MTCSRMDWKKTRPLVGVFCVNGRLFFDMFARAGTILPAAKGVVFLLLEASLPFLCSTCLPELVRPMLEALHALALALPLYRR